MDETFATAVGRGGDKYLQAEATLRAGGAPAIAVLQRHLKDPGRVTRLIARMILAWASGKAPEFQKALDLIDSLAAAAERRPDGTPSPTGVAYALNKAVGKKAVDVLAVRLMKASGWPEWKVMGVLTYLEQQDPAAAAPALVRFAAQTNKETFRSAALEVLAKVPGPELAECIREEKAYEEELGNKLPPAVEGLLPRAPPTPPAKP